MHYRNCFLLLTIVVLSFPGSSWSVAADEQHPRGQLILMGGGVGVHNKIVFHDLIEAAGGRQKARFALLPTASLSAESANHFKRELAEYGIDNERVDVLDVLHSNAQQSAYRPENIEKIDRATAVYMTGGDQVRLVNALRRPDGSDSPLLLAMHRLYQRGGVIAGTSAGASAQSALMLAASGVPSNLVDEGLDALDFGLTKDLNRRGVLVTKGLGFLDRGIIDQHFLQYRGRLGRLSRVVLEKQIPFGIGIDKDSAIRYDSQGKFIVISGRAIVLLPQGASWQADPSGFSMENISLSLLSQGDTFDPHELSFHVHPSKRPILDEERSYRGNFLITDIGSGYAVASALIGGLAENTQTCQDGIVLQYHDSTSHGYRYRFQKTPATKSHIADTLGGIQYSVLNLQLSISPIANGLHPSFTQRPTDLEHLPLEARHAATAIAFRGIMPTNKQLEFRPDEPVSRRDFAIACVRCVHLLAPENPDGSITVQDPSEAELLLARDAGFIKCDDHNDFRLDQPVSQVDLNLGLQRLAKWIPPQCRSSTST